MIVKGYSYDNAYGSFEDGYHYIEQDIEVFALGFSIDINGEDYPVILSDVYTDKEVMELEKDKYKRLLPPGKSLQVFTLYGGEVDISSC